MSKQELTNEGLSPAEAETSERGIDLFAVAVAILMEWRLGVAAMAIVTALSVGLVFLLKPQFVAKATLLPQAGRAESGSIASFFSRSGPGALYVGLLQSRSVQEQVIQQTNLLQHFHTTSVETARDMLNGKSTFTETPDTLVSITVRDGNAQDAARIANAYLDALQSLNDTMGLQQSTQTTSFFEHQLETERGSLQTAETDLARTQRQTGLVAPDAQTQLGLTAIASIRADITSRQVQLAALLQSATEQNPQVETLRSQIAQLQSQERRMEEGGGSPVGAAPPAGQMPQTNLDILRAQREVKYHDTLVTSLANQFETARLGEAFARSAFQIVDRAAVPEHKAWPPRKPYILASLMFGALVGLFAIVVRLTWRRITANPEHQAQFGQLRRAFGRR